MRIWFVSLAILLMIGCSLGYPKEYLKGAITVDKMDGDGEIEAVTFHFKDFPYNVTTGCHLSSKNIGKYIYSGPKRDVHQYECNFNTSLYDSTLQESIQLNDDLSPFAGEIEESNSPLNRSSYIHILAGFCSIPSQIGKYYLFNQLMRENTTTAITFYPKIIDGKTCTILEYTGTISYHLGDWEYGKPTNIVALLCL